MTHDYKRNGTTTLFAALEVAEGHLIGTCMPRYRHQEWIKFLKLIEAIQSFIDAHNQNPKSFTWTAKVETILAKVRRARTLLDRMPSVLDTTLATCAAQVA